MRMRPEIKTELSRGDLLPLAVYARDRRALRRDMMAIKRLRRVHVGPIATFYFENYRTMWHQVHEMLLIEKGGESQIDDELRAYNPLVPKGRELVATVMLEIEDAELRARTLGELGGIETGMFVEIDAMRIAARPETEVERTKADGKTSSVHFVHFDFTPELIAKFRTPGARVTLGIDHPRYRHMAILPEQTREALAGDFA